jgi:hypothetical protein
MSDDDFNKLLLFCVTWRILKFITLSSLRIHHAINNVFSTRVPVYILSVMAQDQDNGGGNLFRI